MSKTFLDYRSPSFFRRLNLLLNADWRVIHLVRTVPVPSQSNGSEMPPPSTRSLCFLTGSRFYNSSDSCTCQEHAGSPPSVPCLLSHCSPCMKQSPFFIHQYPTTPFMHFIIEVFQRSQKARMENTPTCTYGTHGRSICAVNTILQD